MEELGINTTRIYKQRLTQKYINKYDCIYEYDYYYCYFTSCKSLPPVLTGCLSLRFKLLVSRTLLSILPNLTNAVVWMVLILPLISNSTSLFSKPLWTVLSTPPMQPSPSLLLLFTLLEFFTSVLADGLSLEFEWQQVSSSLQDSSRYSGRSQQCCHLDSLYPSTNFQVLQAFNNPLVIVPKATITIGTIVTFMFYSFFQFSSKVEVLILLFTFVQIYSVVCRDS